MKLNLMSRLLQKTQQLPPPLTRDVTVHRNLRVPMRDGVELVADHWFPKSGAEGLPTVLIRTTYGSHTSATYPLARPIAERGFQVFITNARGTFGSGGTFDPLRPERDDGLDTLDWILKQPWFGDSILLYGPSYLGYTQWAVADQVPPQVKAMIPIQSESATLLEFLRSDGFALEIPFIWGFVVDGQERPLALLRHPGLAGRRKMNRLIASLPLNTADQRGVGHRIDYIQDMLAHDAASPYWARADHSARVADVTIPVSSIAGWHDFFLPGQLRDFTALQAAGRPARLTVGPWAHSMTAEPIKLGMQELLDFGLAHARGEQPGDRAPVRLFVQGLEEWRDFASWPPEGYSPQRFQLQPGGGLSTDDPAASAPDGYRYDPADPTPAVGGSRFQTNTGSVDNTRLEARPDVLTYTTPPLDHDVEIIGDVDAEIWFRSSLPFADVFVRVCDVRTDGRSFNVTDGLTSLTDADRDTCARVRLFATAHRFKQGHRIRVQISSGAFPRYNRNPGTGEPRGSATTLRAASQTVFHDETHPSAVILPVRRGD
ncbi:CocE/NonD family hydrolase [Pseudofrankia inefficax]|uniref:Hydrolase CocE/NonD family protein n=1 Tax=Pseudofrankia inefficax (strain DSM 45817 / CECT 9037 / DDB 130130 / EuI1c) TaxID=298654 RepID=E3J999_PSEI1|nr:CocE/NonD family hydrolase [Pseudofrankia inefficax]ADP82118.1 hydrolase CocE/NonD family protein [Pseudofrankia inefficax]